MIVDPNMTFSPQVCNLAIGAIGGAGITMIYLSKILLYFIYIYLIYRVTKIFITKYQDPFKKH